MLVKDHMVRVFQPRFKGNYRVIFQKGNQVEIWPAEGGETVKFHITNVKKIIPVDQAISQLPDYNKLGRLTKLRLNPKNIPDLDLQLLQSLILLLHYIALQKLMTKLCQRYRPCLPW